MKIKTDTFTLYQFLEHEVILHMQIQYYKIQYMSITKKYIKDIYYNKSQLYIRRKQYFKQ